MYEFEFIRLVRWFWHTNCDRIIRSRSTSLDVSSKPLLGLTYTLRGLLPAALFLNASCDGRFPSSGFVCPGISPRIPGFFWTFLSRNVHARRGKFISGRSTKDESPVPDELIGPILCLHHSSLCLHHSSLSVECDGICRPTLAPWIIFNQVVKDPDLHLNHRE